MNGIHDMGGMHGFGPVLPTSDYVPCRDEWERRVLGITFSALCDGYFNSDDIRRATESIPPNHYLNMSYYERWLASTEALLREKGLITKAELDAAQPAEGFVARIPPVTSEVAIQILKTGASTRSRQGEPARFETGDRVRVRNIHPEHHTRMPRYLRSHLGTVVADNGIFSFPDSNSQGLGGEHQHVYSVRFWATDLWGGSASAKDTLQIELFDRYLEASE